MGGTLGAILAQILVALLKVALERADFRARVMAEAAKPGNEAAMAALAWKADAAGRDDGGACLRLRRDAVDITLPRQDPGPRV